MRYKVSPEDFLVEEQVRLDLASMGEYAIYRVQKRGVATLDVQAQMARALALPQSAVIFPALKDKEAVAVQHAAVRGSGPARLPARLSGRGFEAQRIGHSAHPLTPHHLIGNRFTLVLRDLAAEEAMRVGDRLAQMATHGLPNYFDDQRFGSLAAGEAHIGWYILRRDAAGALRAYLTHRFAGDPPPVRQFKLFAAAHWGDWAALFDAAPRPSNYRSVLTYLRDHPHPDETGYRKALNLITRRLLSIYLSAYQSLLWNRIAGRYLMAHQLEEAACVEIAGERLPVYRTLSPHFDRACALPLPGHRAIYPTPAMAAIAAQVLAEEGLVPNDLKARILKNAYLPRGERALLLFPASPSVAPPEVDERFAGRRKLTLTFTLPRGSYATLVVKALFPLSSGSE